METQHAPSTHESPLADYLTEAAAAALLNRTRRSLSAWRRARQGPAWVKIGPTILYPRDGLKAWLESLTVHPKIRRSV